MVGVAGGGVGFWPDMKSGGGGGGGAVGLWPDTRSGGGGGGGGAVGFWPKTKSGGGGGGGGVLSVSGPIRRAGGGGGGGEYGRVSGGPGYSTVVEFMRADIYVCVYACLKYNRPYSKKHECDYLVACM